MQLDRQQFEAICASPVKVHAIDKAIDMPNFGRGLIQPIVTEQAQAIVYSSYYAEFIRVVGEMKRQAR